MNSNTATKDKKNNRNSKEVVHHEIFLKNVIHHPLSKHLE